MYKMLSRKFFSVWDLDQGWDLAELSIFFPWSCRRFTKLLRPFIFWGFVEISQILVSSNFLTLLSVSSVHSKIKFFSDTVAFFWFMRLAVVETILYFPDSLNAFSDILFVAWILRTTALYAFGSVFKFAT